MYLKMFVRNQSFGKGAKILILNLQNTFYDITLVPMYVKVKINNLLIMIVW